MIRQCFVCCRLQTLLDKSVFSSFCGCRVSPGAATPGKPAGPVPMTKRTPPTGWVSGVDQAGWLEGRRPAQPGDELVPVAAVPRLRPFHGLAGGVDRVP